MILQDVVVKLESSCPVALRVVQLALEAFEACNVPVTQLADVVAQLFGLNVVVALQPCLAPVHVLTHSLIARVPIGAKALVARVHIIAQALIARVHIGAKAFVANVHIGAKTFVARVKLALELCGGKRFISHDDDDAIVPVT